MHPYYYNTQRAKNRRGMVKTCWKPDLIWDRIYAQTDLHSGLWIPPCKCTEPDRILISFVMIILMYHLVVISSSINIFIRHKIVALPEFISKYPKACGCDCSAWKVIFWKIQVWPDNCGVLVEHHGLSHELWQLWEEKLPQLKPKFKCHPLGTNRIKIPRGWGCLVLVLRMWMYKRRNAKRRKWKHSGVWKGAARKLERSFHPELGWWDKGEWVHSAANPLCSALEVWSSSWL